MLTVYLIVSALIFNIIFGVVMWAWCDTGDLRVLNRIEKWFLFRFWVGRFILMSLWPIAIYLKVTR